MAIFALPLTQRKTIRPEVYERKSYRHEVDMFSFGSLLFKLLSGERPFPGRNNKETRRRTLELRYSVQGRDWRQTSDAATDLIRKLLIHRRERLRASDALAHHWFEEAGMSVLRPTTMRVHDQRSNAILQVSSYAVLKMTVYSLPSSLSIVERFSRFHSRRRVAKILGGSFPPRGLADVHLLGLV